MRRIWTWGLWASLAVWACAADRGDSPPKARDAPHAVSRSQPELGFDLPTHARTAFEPRAGGWASEASHHTVRVDPDGTVRVEATAVAMAAMRHGQPRSAPGRLSVAVRTASLEGAASPLLELDARGSVVVRRGALMERIENRVNGVEQSWLIAERPGPGDVVVRVQLDAGPNAVVAEDSRGLLITEPATELALRYGVATWVDGLGARTTIASTWHEGQLTLRVPAELVQRSVYPAVLDPLISVEQRVGTVEPGAGERASSRTPSIASNGAAYLAVWSSDRGSRPGRIFAARVDAEGHVLSTPDAADPPNFTGFAVGALGGARVHSAPRVAWTGSDYLVVWRSELGSESFIEGMRVPSAGDLSGRTPFSIASVPGAQMLAPDVACQGAGGCLVVWEDLRAGAGNPAIWGAPVTAGAVGPAALLGTGTAPALAAGATETLLAWRDRRAGETDDSVAWTTVDAAGLSANVAGLARLVPPSGFSYGAPTLAVASGLGGAAYLIAAGQGPTSASRSSVTVAATLNTAGVAVAGPINVGVAAANAVERPRAGFDGTNGFVVWNAFVSTASPTLSDPYELVGRRLVVRTSDAGGPAITVLDTTDLDLVPNRVEGIARTSTPAAVVPAVGGGIALAWGERAEDPDTGADRFAISGLRTGLPADAAGASWSVPVSVATNEQTRVRLAVGANETALAVWQDFRSGPGRFSHDVLAQRVNAQGPVGAAFAVASDAVLDELSPDVAWDGTQWVVAYARSAAGGNMDVRLAHIGVGGAIVRDVAVATGATLDGEPAVVAGAAGRSLVGWVRWVDYVNGTGDIFIRQLASDGTPAGAAQALSTGAGAQRGVRLAYDGSGTVLAVWESNPAANDWNVRAATIAEATLARTPSSTASDGVSISSTSSHDETAPAIATGRGVFVVAWEHELVSGGTGTNDVLAARVLPNATVAEVVALTTAGESRSAPAVAYDGRRFFAVWQSVNTNTDDDRLFGSFASASGTEALRIPGAQAGGFRLDPAQLDGFRPSLSGTSTGRTLLAYARPDRALLSSRIRIRAVGGLGQVCSSAAVDCEPGASCVDGVCCDTACGGGASQDCLACSVAAGASEDGVCASLPLCVEPDGGADASVDASVVDASADASTARDAEADGPAVDPNDAAGVPDAGIADGGDGGFADAAGPTPDASAAGDAALRDAGPPTGPLPRDAGQVTGGDVGADAGIDVAASSGCSCRTTRAPGSSSAPLGGLVLGFVLIAARRRRS